MIGNLVSLVFPRKPANLGSWTLPLASVAVEIMTVARITLALSKGICQTQDKCSCAKGDKVRCHAVRRYSAMMTPVAKHLFKTGEYNHDKD